MLIPELMFLIICCYFGFILLLLRHLDVFISYIGSFLPECFNEDDDSKNAEDDDINVDKFDEKDNLPIDYAWESKDYRKVLWLLEKDSLFPLGFSLENFKEENEDQKRLKDFLDDRNYLHKLIRDDNLDEIKVVTSGKKSRYFFNGKDESAACVAIREKNFKIYHYLKSIGADYDEKEINFHDKNQENFVNLGKDEISWIEDIRSEYCQKNHKAYISCLNSKCKVISNRKPLIETEEYISNLFKKLDRVEEISIILQVVANVNDLEIFFCFDSENVKSESLAPVDANGLVVPEKHKVYISVGSKLLNTVMGTVAQELTHLAMELLFNNNWNPYSESDFESVEEVQKLTNFIDNNIKKKFLFEPSGILTRALSKNYEEKNHQHGELIARIPHILAQFGDEGKEFLNEKVSELLIFYKEKVMPECRKFINEKFRNAKEFIRKINETNGEIINIQKNNLYFENIKKVKKFLNIKNKNIFLLNCKNRFLGILRILQTNDVNYIKSYDYFLVLKLGNCIDNLDKVKGAFYSIPCDMLIIECLDFSKDKNFNDIETILTNFNNKNKKIVFLMEEHCNEFFEEIVEKLNLSDRFVKEKDEDLTLGDLKNDTKEIILSKNIIFQGIEISLNDLLNKNEDLYKYVNGDVIEKLINGEKIEIGCKPFGTSTLEGAYADVVHPINLNALKKEINNSENIFIFNLKKKELIEYIGKDFEPHIEKLEINQLNHKKVLIPETEITNDHFKKLCAHNSKKKIFLINKNKENKLVLKQLYNPDFYRSRNFKIVKKIKIKKDVIKIHLTVQFKMDGTIISSKKFDDIVLVQNSNGIEKPSNISRNVRWLDLEEAEAEFDKFSKLYERVHLLNYENGELIWVKSFGSLRDLRRYKFGEQISFMKENELVEKIKNEKVVIFADDPGMGKSTTIVKLYETKYNSKSIIDTHWVINVKLRDHSEAIKKIDERIFNKPPRPDNLKSLVTFLVNTNLNLGKKISKKLLKYSLFNENFSKPLLIIFDGFDEILYNEDRKRIVYLLKFLMENTKAKFWVTTRLHFKELLEDFLLTFAVEFDPVDDESKKLFIKDYMKDRSKLLLNEKNYSIFENQGIDEGSRIEAYTKEFIKKTEIIFKGDVKRFIGTPLQLHLLLEDSIGPFINWIENGEKSPDFSYLGNNLLEVYQKFFKRKYDIYFRKNEIQRSFQIHSKTRYEEYHEKLAVAQILNTKPPKILGDYRAQLLLVGIVHSENNNFEFVHFTFSEYFFAQSFMNNFEKFIKENKNEYLRQDFRIVMNVLFFRKRSQLSRSFINFKLESINKKTFFKMIDLLWEKNEVSMKNLVGLLYNAIVENHNHIFDLFYSNGLSDSDHAFIFQNLNNYKQTLLHIAVKTENEFAFNLIYENISKLNPEFQFNLLNATDFLGKTVLHYAAEQGKIKFVEKITDITPKKKLLILLCNRIELSHSSALELAMNNYRNDVVKFLFQKILDVMPKKQRHDFFGLRTHNNGMTILQLAAAKAHIETFNLIMKKAEKFLKPQDVFSMICVKDRDGHDVLDYAVMSCNCNQVKIVLQKIFSKKKVYDYLSNLKDSIHLAAMRNSVDVIRLILEETEKETKSMDQLLRVKGKRNRNILHYAAEYSHPELLDLILDKAEKILKNKFFNFLCATDKYQQTALHLVAMTNYNRIYEWVLSDPDAFNCDDEVRMIQIEMSRNNEHGYCTFLGTSKNTQDKSFQLLVEKLKGIPKEQQYELVSMKNELNQTILHYACMTNSMGIIKWINENFDLDKQFELLCVRDIYQQNALHWAVVFGHLHVYTFLGENILSKLPKEKQEEFLFMENTLGKTVFDLADERKMKGLFLKLTEDIFKRVVNFVVRNPNEIQKKILPLKRVEI